MTRVTFLRDTETITASHVCRYSVNHSNVHFITASTAQSEVVQAHILGEVGILGSSVVKGLFQDNPSNFY